jgi:hypothetical protein
MNTIDLPIAMAFIGLAFMFTKDNGFLKQDQVTVK